MNKCNSITTICVIPARYDSSRFPGKSLAPILGKPMIQHVYERAKMATLLNVLLVATDDERILKTVQSFGGQAVMTSQSHRSGTDRIAEVMANRTEDIVINLQGDEPLIEPEVIDAVISPFEKQSSLQVTTLVTDFKDRQEWLDPNVVKVVCDDHGFALYFSRAPIPYQQNKSRTILAKKHVGLYAFRRSFLMKITALPASRLELIEELEQLRILASGERIMAIKTDFSGIGVDVPADIKKVEKLIKNADIRS